MFLNVFTSTISNSNNAIHFNSEQHHLLIYAMYDSHCHNGDLSTAVPLCFAPVFEVKKVLLPLLFHALTK